MKKVPDSGFSNASVTDSLSAFRPLFHLLRQENARNARRYNPGISDKHLMLGFSFEGETHAPENVA